MSRQQALRYIEGEKCLGLCGQLDVKGEGAEGVKISNLGARWATLPRARQEYRKKHIWCGKR